MGREDRNSEAKQGNGEIDTVYSASPASGERSSDLEYRPIARLEAVPFIIGSQNDQESPGSRVIQRNIETKCDTSPGDRHLVPDSPAYRLNLRSGTKKGVEKEWQNQERRGKNR